MDFDDTPEEAAFRAEARAWLEANAGPRTGEVDMLRLMDSPDFVAAAKAWQRKLYDGGWAGITWPKEYGGRGATSIQNTIFTQEQVKREVATGPFMVGIGMAGPTIIGHGTDAQKERYLDTMLRGEEIWCQLFSEPEAGSDLANLATRAVRDGDEWVVNGQKVWTSQAHHSEWGMLLTRTDPDAPKHRGITYFLLDMKTPGVEIRPLVQITGAAHFNEVFLTDVRIPAENVLGEVNGGWAVTMTTLQNERAAIGGAGRAGTHFEEIAALARSVGKADDPMVRQDLARCFTRFQILRYLGLRTQTALSKGGVPGPESSIMKLILSEHARDNGELFEQLQGNAGMLDSTWTTHFLNQWSMRIGGGTDQIQRNAIGERVLGLPAEPRSDKNVPFRELRKGA